MQPRGPFPLVSVVLPVRNGGETIRRAVRSILEQSFTDLELLLIANGSDRGTLERLADLEREDPRIRLRALPEADLVGALNHGLSIARGRYIARMDADDVAHPRRLELQVGHLEASPHTGLVSCLVRHGGDPHAQAGYAAYVDWINTLVSHEEIALHRFVESPIAHPSVVFRSEVAGRHGAWRSGPFPEDYELWLRWLEAGVRMEKVPEVLLEWGDPPDRLSRTDPRYAPRAFFACKAEYLARWLREAPIGGRALLLWGSGRETRRRLRPLLECGIEASGYVDVDPRRWGKRIGGLRVMPSSELPSAADCFVVSCVSSRGARDEIAAFLEARGFVHGTDFILAA